LISDLGGGTVALDTVAFIYFIEEHPRFLPLLLPLFREADEGKRGLVTSAVTLMEVLVVPYRAGNRLLAQRYESLLTRSRGVHLMELTRDQLRMAGQLRASTGIRSADALQLAAAIGGGCSTLVTTGRRLPAIPGLRILDLMSYPA
jgi:predicted nucleic acid-binding protein